MVINADQVLLLHNALNVEDLAEFSTSKDL
jgi:hypothetical protein